jgi:hypothetical protein
LCAFFSLHTGPWVWRKHPAFPAPSVLGGTIIWQNSGATRGEKAQS